MSSRDTAAQKPDAPPLDPAFIERYVGLSKTRDKVLSWARGRVRAQDAEDVTSEVLIKAVERARAGTWPSRDPNGMDIVLSVFLDDVVYEGWKKSKRRGKYEGPMPALERERGDQMEIVDAVEAADALDESEAWQPHGDPLGEDVQVTGLLVGAWLDANVRRPADRKFLALLRKKAATNMTYQEIARAEGIPLTTLSAQVFRFKQRYGRGIALARKRRNAMVFWLWRAGAAAVVAVVAAVAWWLLHLPRAPERPASPTPVPSVTASATPPDLDIALRMRHDAFDLCAARQFGECERLLDEARQRDPVGESDPRVKDARAKIEAWRDARQPTNPQVPRDPKLLK